MTLTYHYILLAFIVTVFVAMVAILEFIRNRAVENIRVHSYKLLLSYYEGKIDSVCGDKGEECRRKLATALARELSRQVKENRVEYIDLEELYKNTEHS